MIRANRDRAKELLKQGVDPRVRKQVDRIEAQAEQAAIVEQEQERLKRSRLLICL